MSRPIADGARRTADFVWTRPKELRELKDVRAWLKKLDVKPPFIESGSPQENSYLESFNGKTRDELLNRELFDTLKEAQILIE